MQKDISSISLSQTEIAFINNIYDILPLCPVVQEQNYPGIVQQKSAHFSCTLSFSGYQTGLGCLQAGKNTLLSFGPHFPPLGELSYFGQSRTFDQHSDFLDVSESVDNLQGWTHTIHPTNPDFISDTSLEITTKLTDKSFVISCMPVHMEQPDDYYMAFFMLTDKIYTNDSIYQKNTINHYKGESKPIQCKTEDDILDIQSSLSTEMQIIPLSGKDHFWEATFLIAYKIDPNMERIKWTCSR